MLNKDSLFKKQSLLDQVMVPCFLYLDELKYSIVARIKEWKRSSQASNSPRTCVKCGTSFIPNSNFQKYCKSCLIFICHFCGKEFINPAVWDNPKYCSWRCFRKSQWAEHASQKYHQTMQLKETDRAWLAALVDGEGALMINKHQAQKEGYAPSYSPILTVGNTNCELIEKIREVVGKGSVTKRKVKSRKPFYSWNLTSGTVIQVVSAIYPYLIVKRELATLLLDYFTKLETDSISYRLQRDEIIPPDILKQREELYQKIKALNQRGPH